MTVPGGQEQAIPDELFADFTSAMRAADILFESGATGGGGTRHFLRDCLIPELEQRGLLVTRASDAEALRVRADQAERVAEAFKGFRGDEIVVARENWTALVASAEAEAESLRQALERTLFIADHLFAMVPQEVWRATGGDDMQGHYEGDYHAAKVAEELAEIRAAAGHAQ